MTSAPAIADKNPTNDLENHFITFGKWTLLRLECSKCPQLFGWLRLRLLEFCRILGLDDFDLRAFFHFFSEGTLMMSLVSGALVETAGAGGD